MERMAPPLLVASAGVVTRASGCTKYRKGVHPVEEFIFKTNRTGNNRNETQEIKSRSTVLRHFF
jgi:hypothetical protein